MLENDLVMRGRYISQGAFLTKPTVYDAVSDVVESGVQSRFNFQIGSRVLKICFKPILMHIYGTQCDFMHRSC